MEIKTKSIVVLEDGKLSAITTQNQEVYIQPPIMVETLDNRLDITVRDKDNQYVQVDVTIGTIDNVPFSGVFSDLETELRLMAKKANQLYFGGGGVPSGGDSSAANQVIQISKDDTQIEQASILNIGSVIDLTLDDGGEWAGFPFTLVGSDAIQIESTVGPIFFDSDTEINKIEDLIEALNSLQSLLLFSKIDATNLLVNDGTVSIDEVTFIGVFTTTSDLEYPEPYSDSADSPISVLHQIHEQQKSILAYTKGIFEASQGGGLTPQSTGKQAYSPTIANNAEEVTGANPLRKSITIQVFEKPAWIRLKSHLISVADRSGYWIDVGGGITIPSDIHTGAISIINDSDGDIPYYSFITNNL